MKTFILLLLLTKLISGNWISLEKFVKQTDKDDDSYCYERTFKIGSMLRNETRRVENLCLTATCLDDRNVKYNGCPLVMIKPPCSVTGGDLSRPYPECCIRIYCNETVQN